MDIVRSSLDPRGTEENKGSCDRQARTLNLRVLQFLNRRALWPHIVPRSASGCPQNCGRAHGQREQEVWRGASNAGPRSTTLSAGTLFVRGGAQLRSPMGERCQGFDELAKLLVGRAVSTQLSRTRDKQSITPATYKVAMTKCISS